LTKQKTAKKKTVGSATGTEPSTSRKASVAKFPDKYVEFMLRLLEANASVTAKPAYKRFIEEVPKESEQTDYPDEKAFGLKFGAVKHKWKEGRKGL
jgi:hypothetical protein